MWVFFLGARAMPVDEPVRSAAHVRGLVVWLGLGVGVAVLVAVLATQLRYAHAVVTAWFVRLAGWPLALILVGVAAALRLTALEADAPARLFPYGRAFTTDEGLWGFLATEWAAGRSPLGSPEYLPGALTLPATVLQLLSTWLFGTSLGALRLTTALLASLQAGAVYAACRRWLGESGAATVGVFLASSFFLVMYQRVAFVDAVLAALSASAFALWLASRAQSWPQGVLVGAMAGLVVAVKPSGVAFLGGLGLAAVIALWQARLTRRTLEFYAAVGVGGVAVALALAASYFAFPLLGQAALATVTSNFAYAPTGVSHGFARLGEVLRREPLWVHMPVVALCGYLGMLRLSLRLFRASTRDPREAFVVGWWLAGLMMLAIFGYIPHRYYLQLVVPLVCAALSFVSALWRGIDEVGARWWRPLLALLLVADLVFSLGRYGVWWSERRFTQRDAGRAIARYLGVKAQSTQVSGPWSFNLAVSGKFRPHGFRLPHLTPRQIEAEGVHYLLRDRLDLMTYPDRLVAPGLTLRPVLRLCFYCTDEASPNLELVTIEIPQPSVIPAESGD